MPKIFIIFSQVVLISFLSCWLNLLYRQNKGELSFLHKYPCLWQWRTIKIIVLSGIIGLLAVLCLPENSIAIRLTELYGIFSTPKTLNPQAKHAFFFIIYSSFLLIMLWSDIEQQIIMNQHLALFAIFGLCFQLLTQPQALCLQLVTAAASGMIFLLLAILTRGGIGGGDIKLLAALGLWLKPEAMELTAVGGIVLGGLVALLALASKRKSRKEYIPYGPNFIVMALLAYLAY